MTSTEIAQVFQDLLTSPKGNSESWLALPGRIDISASIDESCALVLLTAPFGTLRRQDDLETASALLAWNGDHLDRGAPYFCLDERDGMVCLRVMSRRQDLTPELASEAIDRIVEGILEMRARLADSILSVE